jgi:hypothetical protein
VRKRHLLTIGGAAAATLAVCGVAIASWSGSGSGSGRSGALSSVTVTVSAATGSADLYPGFTGGDVFFTLTNSNPFGVTFTSMTPGTVTSSDPANCPASNVTATSKSGLALTAAAGATSSTQSITDVVSMAAGAPNGCQGVSFTIPLTLAGAQS